MTISDFLAGAASRIITPALAEQPIFLAGFQNDRRAKAVHSELFARALALRLAEQALVLVVCDLIGLGRPDVEDIRAMLAASMPSWWWPAHIRIAARIRSGCGGRGRPSAAST
jgi:hypothetical protein